MPGARYDVVFYGEIIQGFDRADVKSRFGRAFSLDEATVERVFAASQLTLKSDLDQFAAQKYQQALAAIGAAVAIEGRARQAGGDTAATAAAQAAGAAAVDTVADHADHADHAERDGGAREMTLAFTGSGAEYCRIWFVNLLLTLATLGIYSAWAKVSSRQYLYQHTLLDGVPFEYLAGPLPILRGQIAVMAGCVATALAADFSYLAAALMAAVLLVPLARLVVGALAFQAHNSAYRNVRCSFRGTSAEAARAYLGWPLLALLSLGALAPQALQRQQAFFWGRRYYGSRAFACSAEPADYIAPIAVATCIALPGGLASYFLLDIAMAAALAVALVTYVAAAACFAAQRDIIGFNSISLGDYRCRAQLGLRPYAVLLAQNTLGIVFTLGLYTPLARVRRARYLCDHMRVLAAADTDDFIAAQQCHIGAFAGSGSVLGAALGEG